MRRSTLVASSMVIMLVIASLLLSITVLGKDINEIQSNPNIMVALTATASYIPSTNNLSEIATEEPSNEGDDAPSSELETYVIQPGDTLFSIARRFNTTTTALATENNIVNRSLIYWGQVIRIPGTIVEQEQQPEPVEPDPEPEQEPQGTEYIVQLGDTLYRIAVRNGTTVAELVRINNIANSSRIFVGQRIILPAGEATETVDTPPEETDTSDSTVDEAENTNEPITTTDTTESVDLDFTGEPSFAMGIEAFLPGQNIPALTNQVVQLGMEWVKIRVDWRDLEPEQGNIIFTDLDMIVDTLDSNNLSILFHVTNAPSWARTSPDENGPPDDLANFETFMTTLVERYNGRVNAYEIWDEPNLRRNWNCDRQICEQSYIELLTIAYNVVNAIDANALVISGGLAPTGFNDGINAIDDRLYLTTLYAEGLRDISDAIAIHAPGWANPPDATCCEASDGVETHYESPVFYFLDNIEAYRTIMVENGDSDSAMWITKFGWGTSEDVGEPSPIHVFVNYTSLEEQAQYIPRAFEIGLELGYVGPMFLDNLNGCQGLSYRVEVCYNSLINPDGVPRPAFTAVQVANLSSVDTTSDEEDVTPLPMDDLSEEEAVPAPEATQESNP